MPVGRASIQRDEIGDQGPSSKDSRYGGKGDRRSEEKYIRVTLGELAVTPRFGFTRRRSLPVTWRGGAS